MKIEQRLCPPEKYGTKCPYTRTPTRIVIHNTANDAPAENEIAYMLNRPEEISFHYAVDDEKAVQGLPLDRNAWASGDGHGKGNMEGIHIEICYSLSGGPKFAAAERNAAQLTADLLKRYGWNIDRVTKHQDYDGKYCPHRTLDLGWKRFLDLVRDCQKEDTVTYEEWLAFQKRYEKEQAAKAVSPWAAESVENVRRLGVMVGDGDGGFRPHSPVTRQELAAVVDRTLSGKAK